MTKKRFTLDEYYHIEDTSEQKIYECGEDTDNILDLLNELNDENELHKEGILSLSSLFDLADVIIDTSDNEKAKQVWNDCKYTKGIGYDFWCGEGHTEYEVFLGETNCPYYEFHDWSKGVPNKTENKRFELANVLGNWWEVRDGDITLWKEEVIDLLNELNDENEQLKQSYKEFEDECQSTFNAMSRKQNDLYRKNFKLKEENEQLKSSDDITELETMIMKLKEENKELKETLAFRSNQLKYLDKGINEYGFTEEEALDIMTENKQIMIGNKRFIIDDDGKYLDIINNRYLTIDDLLNELNELNYENRKLQLYKDYVSDVLIEWSHKNLTNKQLDTIIAIMRELHVRGGND